MGDHIAITYEDWLELLEEVIEQTCRELRVERSIAGRLGRGLAAGAANVSRPYGAQYPGFSIPICGRSRGPQRRYTRGSRRWRRRAQRSCRS